MLYTEEHDNTCRRIAEELEAYADGRVYKCPECGGVFTLESDEDLDKCPHCDEDLNECDPEQLSIYDYFNDCFDIEYRIGSDRQYRSVCVMVACGGPNIYIDTDEKAVVLHWWNEHGSAYLDTDTVNAIDGVFEELFNC